MSQNLLAELVGVSMVPNPTAKIEPVIIMIVKLVCEYC